MKRGKNKKGSGNDSHDGGERGERVATWEGAYRRAVDGGGGVGPRAGVCRCDV